MYSPQDIQIRAQHTPCSAEAHSAETKSSSRGSAAGASRRRQRDLHERQLKLQALVWWHKVFGLATLGLDL